MPYICVKKRKVNERPKPNEPYATHSYGMQKHHTNLNVITYKTAAYETSYAVYQLRATTHGGLLRERVAVLGSGQREHVLDVSLRMRTRVLMYPSASGVYSLHVYGSLHPCVRQSHGLVTCRATNELVGWESPTPRPGT